MKLLVSALEPSANVHLERLLGQLGSVEIEGIFSGSLGTPLYDSKDFSIMGFADAIAKLPLARLAVRDMVERAPHCDAVLMIDSSGFHITLAKAIKRQHPHAKIIYYILPQVWAWRPSRIPLVESTTDIQACILPFEKSVWSSAIYVGHPLMEEISTFKEAATTERTVAFLPGSRRGEISRLMPVYREVAAKLSDRKLLVIPPHFDKADIQRLYGDISGFEISRSTHEALHQSRFAWICSGTATLEAALIGTPFALAYQAKPIDYWIARRFVKLPYVGLSNVILSYAGREPVHLEYIQKEVTPENLLQAMSDTDPTRFLERSRELRQLLSTPSDQSLPQVVAAAVTESASRKIAANNSQ
ncbi:lipid-A-disaccharide synthase [Desulfurispira natronophila]|uniref:Lipid-A-disaccharide synthase n=1 Tax=Desulfurispira natronophila TaxID=682562 RepID=A0A7W8DHA8_9BACT|nr:lipid-A-disaccharide synthase [Desulfurispira natronophila]MBB5022366.1 lipid-A-disaccharide synthase [Desulfurispira natronophila]